MQTRRRNVRAVFTLLLGMLAPALLGACGSSSTSSGDYTLTVTGVGYTPHVGQTVHFSVLNAASGASTGSGTVVVAADGTFSAPLGKVLFKGASYDLDFYADGTPTNPFAPGGNGMCDATDHQWQVAVTDANGDGVNDVSNMGTPTPALNDVTINTTHNTNFTSICAAVAVPAPMPYDTMMGSGSAAGGAQ
jgi:hypothetical protein